MSTAARDAINAAVRELNTALEHLDAAEDTQETVLEASLVDGDAPDPRWLSIARAEIGTREIPGERHNPRVLEYLATTSLGRWGRERDETAWCSAFANWCFARAGLEGTGSAMARSWLGWGVELERPRPGCVVVLRRGAPPSGHVAFFVGRDGDKLQLLGGNQGNMVGIRDYPASRVLSYRWPVERVA